MKLQKKMSNNKIEQNAPPFPINGEDNRMATITLKFDVLTFSPFEPGHGFLKWF